MRKEFEQYTDYEDCRIGSTIAITSKVHKRELAPEVFEYRIELKWDAARAREQNAEVAVLFLLPCKDLQYMWHPDCRARRVLDADWRLNLHSMLTASAPVAMLFNGAGLNTYTFATDEVRKVTSVEFGVKDEGGSSHISGKIQMGLRQFDSRDHTMLRIRADYRRVPCQEALDDVRAWWEKTLQMPPMPVPDAARKPVYSSWYSFHKDIDASTLEEECRLAKEMGMETIIVDDGWQTAEDGTGYGYTGDWEPCPGKFPNMRAFVDHIHALGMKVMMWYSVPFVGYFSGNWERFRDMILRREDRNHTGVLDPRYPEVRRFVQETYVAAVNNYDLDGLKLDFIDRIQKPDQDEIQPGMDYECVQEAADRMMIDVMQALTAIRPDILIEFRQHYIGPCMRQFGNMFRVSDCPADIATNRIGMMDMRMLSGNTAVHSDMVTWHDDDRPEDAALQILNTIFGVTQFSRIIGKMRPDHRKMTEFWFRFERENQRVLQESRLIPSEPQFLYPVITACDEQEEIIAVYADSKVISPDFSRRKTQLVNACWQPFLTVRVPEETKAAVTIYDCMGNTADDITRVFPAGIQEIAVPRSGLAVIMPIQK